MATFSDTSSQTSNHKPTKDRTSWLRPIRLEVMGLACSSTLSFGVIVLLIWVCVVRGDCSHNGPDACASRRLGDASPGYLGNADIYGLGIRMGIYCQWFASIIANALLTEKARRVTAYPYGGFQLAMLAALLYLVFKSDCTFTSELFLILYILLGGVFIVLAPELIKSLQRVEWSADDRPQYRVFSTVVWTLLGWVVPVSAWFWIRLAVVGEGTDFYRTPGGTSMFLIGRMQNGQIRMASILMAVWSITLGLFALEKIALACLCKALGIELRPTLLILLHITFRTVVLLFTLLGTATREVFMMYVSDPSRSPAEYIPKALSADVRLSIGDIITGSKSSRSERVIRLYGFILASFSATLSMCAVELTLAWNSIVGVNSIASTGQIVAMFVGMSTLVPVFWQLSKGVRSDSEGFHGEDGEYKSSPRDLEAVMHQPQCAVAPQSTGILDNGECKFNF